jgi:hypothetical protein
MPTHVRELLAALRIGTVMLASALSPVVSAAPAAAPPPARPTTEPAVSRVPASGPDASEPEPTIGVEPETDTPAEPTGPADGGADGGADTGPTASPAATAALQQDARALRDELFKARARVSIVASRLFTTRIALQLRSNLERFYAVSNLTLRIDGAPVYVQASGLPQAAGDLFDVFAAPGSHELSFSAELVSRRDATYKLRLDHAITFAVEADTRVATRLQLHEHGNMWRFASRQRGQSDVRIRLRAQAKRTHKGKRATKASAGGKASVGTGGKP